MKIQSVITVTKKSHGINERIVLMSALFEAVDALDFPPAPVTKVRKPVGALQVASQQRHLPWLKGKIVMPSGLFPSPRLSPLGSRYDGV